MAGALQDLRRALAALLRAPAFTATATLILALGIGANAAIFSLVDRILLRPLPYPQPERLVAIVGAVPSRGVTINPLSAPDFTEWQRDSREIPDMAAVFNAGLNLTGGQEPQMLSAGRVSWTFFKVLGVPPALGRGFLPEEDRDGGPAAVVLAHEFWQRRFGGDPGLVGRSIRLDGRDVTVVGVLPKDFSFPFFMGRFDVLVPASFSRDRLEARGNHFFGAVGRLRPGTTVAAAQEELRGFAARQAREFPDTNANFTVRVCGLQEMLVKDARATLLMLTGAVAAVLLIACANLMNLMLARAARRQREMAVRAALGAGPAALVREALAESLVLGLLGGCFGLLLGRWTLDGLARLLDLAPRYRLAPALDGRLVLFTLGLSVLAALLTGLMPALKGPGPRLADALKEGKGSATSSHPRLRGLLVAAETALATALLVGAGLMLRTLLHLQTVDPGVKADHLLMAQVILPNGRFKDPAARTAFLEDLRLRLAALPGVSAAALSDSPPLMGSTSSSSYDLDGREFVDDRQAILHHVSSGYFRAMGIPVLRGRDLAPGETGAVVINQAMARHDFPGADPLQGRLSVDRANQPMLPIVGVVGDVRHQSMADPMRPEMYYPMGGGLVIGAPTDMVCVALRTVPEPQALVPALKQAVAALDPDLPVNTPRAMTELMARDRKDAQARSLLLGGFAALALVLAGVGIFAVVNFLTALRTREIGVRMAMGARVADVLALVVGQGLRMALAGTLAGVAIALALRRALEAQVVGVRTWDPVTLAGVVVLLVLVAALACLLPAARAARVDPMVALRSE